MKKIQIISLILLSIITTSGFVFVLGQNKPGQNDASINMTGNTSQPVYLALAQPKKTNSDNQKTSTTSNADNDETVVINVSNFGRSNPFKPFVEKSLIINETISQPPLINVPRPPEYNPDPNLSTLMGIKVSGIMYDASRPSAIIKIDKSDYLVHKGDFLFNFYVKDITSSKVAIKYRNNTYKAGIGEIIEGIVNINPVKNKQIYADNKESDSTRNIKLVNPVNLPTLPAF